MAIPYQAKRGVTTDNTMHFYISTSVNFYFVLLTVAVGKMLENFRR